MVNIDDDRTRCLDCYLLVEKPVSYAPINRCSDGVRIMLSTRNPTDVRDQTTRETDCADANTPNVQLQCSHTMSDPLVLPCTGLHLFVSVYRQFVRFWASVDDDKASLSTGRTRSGK